MDGLNGKPNKYIYKKDNLSLAEDLRILNNKAKK